MTLRRRLLLILVPLFLLLGLLGGSGIVLLSWLGGRIDLILRENYRSILAMKDLDEALEDMDASFQITLAGRPDRASTRYHTAVPRFRDAIRLEQHSITVPGERELVDQLVEAAVAYEQGGDAFHAEPLSRPVGILGAGPAGPLTPLVFLLHDWTRETQERLFFGSTEAPGLSAGHDRIRDLARQIVQINQDDMERANREAADGASRALLGFTLGLIGVAVLAAWLARQAMRTILRPLEAVTQSALAIGAGNLDQVVPVVSHDELGQLADAFNLMARQLRHYRQSHYQQLLRAQRTSQATIDSFPHPVLVVDQEGKVSMANPSARRLLGVTPASAGTATGVEQSFAWQPPEALRQPLEDALRKQRAHVTESFSQALAWRTGDQEHFFLPQVSPIQEPFGATLGAAVLLEDVTRFRLLDQIKSSLAATVSHELKTPLTGLRLALHVLIEESVGPLSPKQMELLIDARENAERLLQMVNELLDLTRLEEGRLRLELRPSKPEVLLQTAADRIRPRAEDKNLRVVVDAPANLPDIMADADRLGSVLQNLLTNAVTYTDPGGTITLRARAAEDAVVLEVADTGCGIPESYLPYVFDKFFRVPDQVEAHGTGLGLAIVREVVNAHHGTVNCQSQVGEGTVFRLKIPIAR
jgi:two-component system, NtrC family, sensor histidine kinase KinB